MSKTSILSSPSKFLDEWKQITAPKLFLLTAPSGAGKTTWCLQLAKDAADVGIPVSGLCSPAIFEMEHKIAIDLLDLRTSTRKRLATLKPETSIGLATEHWLFDETTVQWGNSLLKRPEGFIDQARSENNPSGRDELFILDELGPLELERNLGFTAAFPILDARQHHLACVVVRPSLLSLAQARWHWAEVLNLTS